MQKAILDTCFLERFNRDPHIIDDFRRLMDDAEFQLVVHPYVYDNEMNMFSYVTRLIEQGTISKVDYSEFITSEYYKEYYSYLFIQIYNEFYETQKQVRPYKAETMIELDQNIDIFEFRKAQSSLGDVHIVLMALFMDIPIILSEDEGDMSLIFRIAKRRMDSEHFELKLYSVNDVIDYVKAKDDKKLTGRELKHIRRSLVKQ